VGDNIEWSLHQCNNEKKNKKKERERERERDSMIEKIWSRRQWLSDDEIFDPIKFQRCHFFVVFLITAPTI